MGDLGGEGKAERGVGIKGERENTNKYCHLLGS